MDDDGRQFKALNIAPRFHLAGKVRFPPQKGLKAPPISSYRNNLTALSQYHNLLFIAYVDEIYVYQPQFPRQKISSKPQLEFKLPATQPGLSGYIDQGHPHAVNQLVIGDLGNEEILVATCDDGDVVAYSTRHIYNAIEIGQDIGPTLFDPVRPFFKRNVGMSAWGIAIHKTARLIAISSNTKQIKVFAFAVGQRSPSERSSPFSDEDLLGDLDHDPGGADWRRVYTCSPDQRSRNLEIILKGHSHNIPNIAFCNTEDDLLGRYLVSTDINGWTYVWDIWKGAIVLSPSDRFRFGDPLARGWHRGWNVACIDPRSCRVARSNIEAFGHDVVRYENPGYGVESDNSPSLQQIPDSSRWHPSYSRYTSVPGMLDELAGLDTDLDEESDGSFSDDEGGGYGVDPLHPDPNVPPDTTNEPHSPIYLFTLPHSQLTNISPTPDPPTRPDPNSHPQPPTPSAPTSPLPFHLLQTFESNISLSHSLHPSSPSLTHTLTTKMILTQAIPPSLHLLHSIQRINMLLQIPELGLVVLGCQMGRVALMTVTVMQRGKGEERVGGRVDWILPFHSQEAKGERPEAPLLGIAVGPIQGRERTSESAGDEATNDGTSERWRAVEHSRRYRLLMTYDDHTILSYEIWRSANENGDNDDDHVLIA